MTFAEVLAQVRELLQSKGRVSYRALKLQFSLDDDYLEGLKDELIEAERGAADEGGKVLVWVGASPVPGSKFQVQSSQSPTPGTQPLTPSTQTLDPRRQTLDAAERRQLTVLFCDLVGSTTLSAQLDPEEYREVVRAYHETCAGIINRYAGHTAQHLGDGILVYFGYPAAHEDDAARAMRTGLEIVEKIHTLTAPSPVSTGEGRGEGRLQVRIGIHTGLVVIGEIGSTDKHEILALGETPNIAARLQGLAAPDTVVVSGATSRLVQGLFECQDLGSPELKGVTTPLAVYRVMGESGVQSRFEVAVRGGLTPLVGREEELGLLQRRWEQAKTGAGQVVLLSGEPGIGKSRLVQTLKEHVMAEGATRIEFRCSPYHQNSAFYPIVEHLQRLLQFEREDSPQAKFTKLQQALAAYRFPQADTLPLLATLLSLLQPEGVPPLTLSPQKQKQKTQEALVAWIMEESEKAAVYCVWEDLHWADPSTLEVLTLYLEQIPTTRVFTVLTFRPDFTPPWRPRSHLTQLMLNRLGRPQVEAMVEKVTGGKALPAEVVQQIVGKTDGVPLFVEELTKSVLESVESIGSIESVESLGSEGRLSRSSILLRIPATLQDALMARLDRLGTTREIAQLGATIGREFSYELLAAISQLEGERLQQGLKQLVEAELVYQRGLLPQARYLFKHALIQDVAYQSLLKSTRQQLHTQIAQVLEERFQETVETHPELVAHHYTEGGLFEQAIPYWQQAGQKSVRRAAHVEALSHVTQGLTLLKALPQTPARARQELRLQLTLGEAVVMAKGSGSAEREQVLVRARELCQQVGETPELFFTLSSLLILHLFRAEFPQARELAEQLLTLAQRTHIPHLLMFARWLMGETLLWMGAFGPAREQVEQGIAFYETQQYRPQEHPGFMTPLEPCLHVAALALWMLGYPDQARKRIQEAQEVAGELAQPFALAVTLNFAAGLHTLRGDVEATHEVAEQLITLSTEQGFPDRLAQGIYYRGLALTMQGQGEEGLAQMRQGVAGFQATGAKVGSPARLAGLAAGYGSLGQPEEGLSLLTEALELVDKTGERFCEAELYRLAGELSLRMGERETGRTGEEEKITHSPIPLQGSASRRLSRLRSDSKRNHWSCGR